MSSHNIQLEIVLDGIKPKVLADNYDFLYPEHNDLHVNSIYPYSIPGAEEIIRAVKVVKDANCSHNYYFAPYEATPQVFYLHDSYLGGNMCAYPDLLLYVYYNFIIDIDIENDQFEWVTYSKENRVNENKNLARMFINSGYYLSKGSKYKEITTDEIKKRVNDLKEERNYGVGYNKVQDGALLELIEYPYVMTILLEINPLRRAKYDQALEFSTSIYGARLSKMVYFCLFKGLITPKICEKLATGKMFKKAPYLKNSIEAQYLSFNSNLNSKASQNLDENYMEELKLKETESTSTAESQPNGKDATVDSLIAKMINSSAFNDTLSSSSEDYINTINL